MAEEGGNFSTTQARAKCRFVLFEVFRITPPWWPGMGGGELKRARGGQARRNSIVQSHEAQHLHLQ
ncbi:hypothetical protein E2C01_062992 [Portunus trituberculatus]|uniref:Uncharacterized protein n=1 Tax=Portunus trituberculatus TaxID=210409 RepID=A0A5B7HCJ7_PORTR|nr:hypothetical protein [Portunus trituberculatus]